MKEILLTEKEMVFVVYCIFSIWVFFYKHSQLIGQQGQREAISTFLPIPPASQTLRHQSSNYCREITSVQSQQLGSNQESQVSERKPLTTKLRSLKLVKVFLKNKLSNVHVERPSAVAASEYCNLLNIADLLVAASEYCNFSSYVVHVL